MWSIASVKKKSWNMLKKSYWTAFLIGIITMFAVGNSGIQFPVSINIMATMAQVAIVSSDTEEVTDVQSDVKAQDSSIDEQVMNYDDLYGEDSGAAFFAIAIFAYYIFILLMALAFKIFLLGPLEVGCRRFFTRTIRNESDDLNEVTFGFRKGRYFRSVLGIFIRDLYLMLWGSIPVIVSLIAVGVLNVGRNNQDIGMFAANMGIIFITSIFCYIVMIIKYYSYALVPFILTEDENMRARDAVKKSKMLMRGNKFHLFLLQISFIGWYLLGFLAFFVGTIFVYPYYQMAMGAFYEEVRNIDLKDKIELRQQ